MMSDNVINSLPILEGVVPQALIMKVNGNNVTLTFSPERNDAVSNQIKKILLESYINKKL